MSHSTSTFARWLLVVAVAIAFLSDASPAEAKPRKRRPMANEVEEADPFVPIAQWPLPGGNPLVPKPPLGAIPMPPLPPAPMPEAPMPPARGAAVYKPVGAAADLSASADPKNSVAGAWTSAGGVLRAGRGGGDKRIALVAPPSEAYVWDVTFQRVEGKKQFCLMFPVSGHPAQVWIGGMAGQHSSIEGPTARDYPAAHIAEDRVKNNADQKVRLVVVPNGDQCYIDVLLDGAPYLRYQGPINKLKVYGPYKLPDGTKLALMSHDNSTFEFKKMSVQALGAQ